MQISLKWINELVKIETIKLDYLIEKLIFGGFEVEDIIEIEINKIKHITLDISATANRSDSLSIQGISTEIVALLNKPFSFSHYLTTSDTIYKKILKHEIILPLNVNPDCSFISSVIIENVKNVTVPKWLKNKLICSGIIPTNTLTDFQTYILLETGYTFGFYDFDKISSKLNNKIFNLSVSNAKNGEKFLTNNGKKYELNESILVIKAKNIILGIAGLIESDEFTYSDKTTSILIEGSIFKAAKIRQQSRNLGIRTDRSKRYEKSLKNTYLIQSYYRLISLLRISNPTITVKWQTIAKRAEQEIISIKLKYQTVKEILGPIDQSSNKTVNYISTNLIEDYLKRLNFDFIYNESEQMWTVTVPHSRSEDISREIDLIEEIGRIHGFNNFLITLPKLSNIGIEDISYKTRKRITVCLLNLGLNELIHYSLVNEITLLTNEIKLVNPLVSEYANLRSSLLPSLIKTVQENLQQSNSIINGFEYGHIFLEEQKNQFLEKNHVAGIFGGFKIKPTWSEPPKELTWFEAKGQIEQLFSQLNLSVLWKNNSSNQLLHSYRSANIYSSLNKKIGTFGQINPILANKINLPSAIYLFEFNVETIQNSLQTNNLSIYQEYSLYPKIIKDISFIVKKEITVEDIQQIIYLNGTKYLSKVNLLDEYSSNFIYKNSTSLCIQLIFQSNDKTLQNNEIDGILNNICSFLIQEFDIKIRN